MGINLNNPCTYCKGNPRTCSKNKMGSNLLTVILSNTDRCNNACEYCWHRARINETGGLVDMNADNIRSFMEAMDKQFPDFQMVYVILGGEPTLNLGPIDMLMAETLRRRGTVFCTIITNGRDNIEEVVELLSKYQNMRIQVSLPTDINYIHSNIKTYIKLQEAYDIEFSLVVTEEDVYFLKYALRHYKKMGVRKLFLNFEMQHKNFMVHDKLYYERELVDVFNYYAIELKDFNFSIGNLAGLDLRPEDLTVDMNGPNKNYIFDYYADNNFYATHFTESTPIGNTTDGVDVSMVEKIEDLKKCSDCEYTKLCSINRSIFLQNDLQFVVNPEVCFPYQVTARYIMRRLGVES